MARTLTDVYIKVTEKNHSKVSELLQSDNLPYGIIYFNFDDIKSWSLRNRDTSFSVSLSELNKLIETIPTREEITRLKRQISAYKTNLSLTNERCKELQSDNENLSDVYFDLLNKNKQLKQRKWYKFWK